MYNETALATHLGTSGSQPFTHSRTISTAIQRRPNFLIRLSLEQLITFTTQKTQIAAEQVEFCALPLTRLLLKVVVHKS